MEDEEEVLEVTMLFLPIKGDAYYHALWKWTAGEIGCIVLLSQWKCGWDIEIFHSTELVPSRHFHFHGDLEFSERDQNMQHVYDVQKEIAGRVGLKISEIEKFDLQCYGAEVGKKLGSKLIPVPAPYSLN